MGLLSTPPSTDPRSETGAYLELQRRLYWVLGPDKPGDTLIRVEDCRTGDERHLSIMDVKCARLIKAAPVLDVPDTIPEAAA